MSVSKVHRTAAEALAGHLKDGMTIMSGGFGLCGIPTALIEAIRGSRVARDLKHAHELVVPNGVVNTSPKDHVGLDQRASVMGVIRNGKFVYLSQ